LRQRNQFASLTAIGMAALFWLHPARLSRWPALAAIAWLAIGNASTTSRTGLTQMILLGALTCVWAGPRRQRLILWLGGLLAYAVAALALPWLLETLTGVPGNRLWERVASVESCSSRTVLWSNVLHLVGERPWTGWGWGELDYAHFASLYDGPRFCDILDNAHNLPLHLAVELGIPAALFLCGGLVWATVRARPWAEPQPARQMAWAVLAVIGVHSLLEYPLWYGPFQIAFGLCLGLLWPATERNASPGTAPARTHFASVAVAASVAVMCAYAAWDYWRVSQIYLPPEARSPAMREDPLPEIRRSWLFRNQARFAELTITPLTRENAAWTFDSARALLHYSPEPRVIEKLIESATVLGREQEMLLDLARFRAAFPEAYSNWSKARAGRGASPADQPPT
jgi:O-antigen ligase